MGKEEDGKGGDREKKEGRKKEKDPSDSRVETRERSRIKRCSCRESEVGLTPTDMRFDVRFSNTPRTMICQRWIQPDPT